MFSTKNILIFALLAVAIYLLSSKDRLKKINNFLKNGSNTPDAPRNMQNEVSATSDAAPGGATPPIMPESPDYGSYDAPGQSGRGTPPNVTRQV